MCVCLMNMHLALEQQEQAEKSMECLRIVYWLSVSFIKQPQYSDLLGEVFKEFQASSELFDSLVLMNAEINKVMAIALERSDRHLADRSRNSKEDLQGDNKLFIDFINNHLYLKENAQEINEVK